MHYIVLEATINVSLTIVKQLGQRKMEFHIPYNTPHSLPDDLQSPDTAIDSSSSTPSTSFSDSTSSLISISATDSPDDSISGKNDSLASTTLTEISTETDKEAMHTMLQEQQRA